MVQYGYVNQVGIIILIIEFIRSYLLESTHIYGIF